MKMKKESKRKTGCQQSTLMDTLYEDHDITEDMVIGPVVLQRPSLRLTFQSTVKHIESHRSKETKTIESKTIDTKTTETKTIEVEDKQKCKNICHSGGEEHYTCAHCDKQISTKPKMIAHLRDHVTRPFTCTLCLKTFTSRNTLKRHIITHSNERKFACNVCNRTYKAVSSLDNHKLTHQPKQFECKYCQKRFTQKIQLQVHERSHTGEKPYECKFCFKQFTQLTSLKNHALIHTDVKPYCCSFCEKKFRQVSNLRQHVLKNHPNEEADFRKKNSKKHSASVSLAWYSCKNCQAVLTKKSDISKHVKLCHKQKKN